MTAKQISVFLQNQPGKLADFCEILSKHHIDMRAMSMAESRDFGILRLIVDDSQKTADVLKEEGYVYAVTPVLAVEVPDEPGGLMKILNILKENQINLEYSYAFIARKTDCAYMIFRVQQTEQAIGALTNGGVKLICQHELSEL